jgi:hypothetical protein
MLPLSEEQQIILNYIKEGYNIKVDAVAGSGKSTTVLSIAKENPDKKVLQLTYNASLRAEIKEKVKSHELTNLHIHTYHSLAVKYYLSTAYTDTGIRYILYHGLPCSQPIPHYDILVIDEAQDMTLIYYKLIVKFIDNMYGGNQGSKLHGIQVIILGDVKQGLYEFKGSDIRFLSLADKIWETNPYLKTSEFKSCRMRMSYRITNQICYFINHVMLGKSRLDACRNGEPVKYIRNSLVNIEKYVIYEINRLLATGRKPSEIFILGGSVKGPNSYIRKIENALVRQGIPCYVPMIENTDKIEDRVIDGKIVFSTFHCVKGRQRPFVFLVGFDNSYFTYYARTLQKDRCPNTLYVGATRASETLYLLEFDQYSTDRPLEFLRKNHHEMKNHPYIDFKGIPRTIFYQKEENLVKSSQIQEKHFITPTDLIKFVPESTIEDISPIIDRIFIKEPVLSEEFAILGEIEIPTVIKTKQGFYEEVSDLNGIAIPMVYYSREYREPTVPNSAKRYPFGGHKVASEPLYEPSLLQEELKEGITKEDITKEANYLHNIIEELLKEVKENQHGFLREIIKNIPQPCTSIGDYLYLANIYIALQERLYFKLKQIDRDEYTWLSDSMIEKCTELLQQTIGKECRNQKPLIEQTILHGSDENLHKHIDEFLGQYFPPHEKFRFTARIDMMTDVSIWEIKCTSKISIDNLLQVVIYAWLWRMTHEEERVFRIINIKSGELMRLECTMEELHFIVLAILKGKYVKHEVLSDVDFLQATTPSMEPST